MTSTTSIWPTQERSNSSRWGQGLTALASSAPAAEGQRRRPSSLIDDHNINYLPARRARILLCLRVFRSWSARPTTRKAPAYAPLRALGPRELFPEPLADTHWENSAPGPCAPSANWLVHIFTTPKAKKIGNNDYRKG